MDKLVRVVGGKFNGLNCDIWKRTAQSVISMRHLEVAYIIEGQKCPQQIKIQQRGRTPTRQSPATTRSRGQQQHGTEDNTPARNEDEDQEGEQQGEHQGSTPTSSATARSSELVPATAAVPTSLLWSMGSDIVNAEEIKASHQNNWMLFNFLFLSTTGAVASFLLRYKLKSGEIPNGKAAWIGMTAKYQYSTRERRRVLKNQFVSMVMSDGQDPDVFINEIYHLRDELVEIGEVINDDSPLDIVLEGLTDDYLQIKYNAEADDSFTLDNAIYTMLNMHANRIAKHGPSKNQKGRESAMVSTFNKGEKCHVCNKTGHWARYCYHRKSSMNDTNKASKKWCSLHKIHLYDNPECRSQQQQLNGNSGINRNNRNGQRNGQHHATTTTPAHANPAIKFRLSTTVVENCNNAAASIPGTTTATSTTSTETPVSTLHATPPQGIGCSFIASSSTTSNVNLTMTADSGESIYLSTIDFYLA